MDYFGNKLRTDGSKRFTINYSSPKKEFTVMHKDTPLLKVNDEAGTVELYEDNRNLLPFALRGKSEIRWKDYYAWAINRSLSPVKENASIVFNECCIGDRGDKYAPARIARLMSMEDRFWIRENDDEKFEDFDLRKVELSEIIAKTALHGNYGDLYGNHYTPELTHKGTFATSWEKNQEDGHFYMYKKSKNFYESEHEVLCSDILEKLGIDHIKYEMAPEKGEHVCKCQCMSENCSRLSYNEFESYCYDKEIDPLDLISKRFSKDWGTMFIMDYVFSNPDRHGENWGFLYDDETGRIMKMHPLMDQNRSFDPEYSESGIFLYQLVMDDGDLTTKRLAEMAQSKLQIDFTPILEDKELRKRFEDTKAAYDTFIAKCEEMQGLIKSLDKELPIEDMDEI